MTWTGRLDSQQDFICCFSDVARRCVTDRDTDDQVRPAAGPLYQVSVCPVHIHSHQSRTSVMVIFAPLIHLLLFLAGRHRPAALSSGLCSPKICSRAHATQRGGLCVYVSVCVCVCSCVSVCVCTLLHVSLSRACMHPRRMGWQG